MKRKRIIAVIGVAFVIGSCGGFSDKSTTSLTPSDLATNLLHQKEVAFFDKANDGNEYKDITKFEFKDFEGGCVYSLDQKTFLVTQNSEASKVICYLDCMTKVCGKPKAITKTGNYLIVETSLGEIAGAKLECSERDKVVTPTDTIAIDELPEQERNSLYELIEN